MGRLKNSLRRTAAAMSVCVLISAGAPAFSQPGGGKLRSRPTASQPTGDAQGYTFYSTRQDLPIGKEKQTYPASGMTDANGKPLSLQVTQEESYCRLDGKAKSGLFHLEIAEPGRYQLGLRYLPTEEKQENMEVSVLLDGKTPFYRERADTG